MTEPKSREARLVCAVLVVHTVLIAALVAFALR